MEVSIRDFQLKASEYLEDLPIILTRYNVPIAKIIPVGEKGVNTPPAKKVDTSVDTKEKPVTKPDVKTKPSVKPSVAERAKEKAEEGYGATCQVEGCDNSGSTCRIDREKVAILCDEHFKKYSKNHRVVKI